MPAEYKPKSRKKWLKELFGRRRAASPAPSATPSTTDVRSSDQGNAEHGSKASSMVATESCAPPSPSATAAQAARPDTDARVPNDYQPPAALQALPPALPAKSAPKPLPTESTQQPTPALSVSERPWNAAYDSLCARCVYIFGHGPRRSSDLMLIIHHESREQLVTAAGSGCALCREVVKAIQAWNHSPTIPAGGQDSKHYTRCSLSEYDEKPRTRYQLWFWLSSGLPLPPDRNSEIFAHFEVVSRQSKYWRTPAPILQNSTQAEGPWQHVLRWYHDCLANHGRCGRQHLTDAVPWYPTRLLDLGTPHDDVVRLTTTADSQPNGPYITLSHRWGEGNMLKLTTANLTSFQCGIPLGALPRSFAEAITVTRRLGVRYLWIDSLCIIQDSVQDWQSESARMASVYKECHLNIAATASDGPAGGLFRERHPDPSWPLFANANFGSGDHRTCLVRNTELSADQIENSPLNIRAWVVQERLLSPRKIHFSQEQLFWECRERYTCEMFAEAALGCQDQILQLPDAQPNTTGLGQYHDVWGGIVRKYSRCGITVPSDKLVGLSGLARHISGAIDDQYLAGLWKSTLPTSLLWSVSKWRDNGVCPYRPDRYRAPSWAWPSVEGQVHLWRPEGADVRDAAKVDEVAASPLVAENPFGEITSGYIRLSGCLFGPVRLAPGPDPRSGQGIRLYPGTSKHEQFESTVDPDVILENPIEGLFCLIIAAVDTLGAQRRDCLLVLPVEGDEPDTYRRFGLVSFEYEWDMDDWFGYAWSRDGAKMKKDGCRLESGTYKLI